MFFVIWFIKKKNKQTNERQKLGLLWFSPHVCSEQIFLKVPRHGVLPLLHHLSWCEYTQLLPWTVHSHNLWAGLGFCEKTIT